MTGDIPRICAGDTHAAEDPAFQATNLARFLASPRPDSDRKLPRRGSQGISPPPWQSTGFKDTVGVNRVSECNCLGLVDFTTSRSTLMRAVDDAARCWAGRAEDVA